MCMIRPVGPVRAALITLLAGLHGGFTGVYGYLRRNRLRKVAATFGALLLTIFAVWILAPPELRDHINAREVLHVGFGFSLCALFWIVVSILQRRRGRRFAWQVRYFLPLAMLLSINATNEWGLAMTFSVDHWPESEPLIYLGGDWARAGKLAELTDGAHGGWKLQMKSIADMAAWAFGALACLWFLYKEADGIWEARSDRLQWAHERKS